ncbi:8693_t:CDS:2 [Cetraspora pellucida]|uniref:8693_t:CDS:1 n=1 Tax=Cetraspora pellucida TaxID=1433469 RepID=A0A9N9FS59_9GLOM|nr:8693_t:CDS:2 [Cetraspora pellucida]
MCKSFIASLLAFLFILSPTVLVATITPGQIITNCAINGTAAITFDDGPSEACDDHFMLWTHELLDFLKDNGITATFFINGDNYNCIYDYADVILRIHEEGHQIGSHTWSHPDLTLVNQTEVFYQITSLEKALKKILGLVPKYLRPPYGSYNDEVINTIESLGYTIVLWNLDTIDSLGGSVEYGLEKYRTSDGPPSSHIVLDHDSHKLSCQQLGPQGIQIYLDKGFKLMSVAECIGETDSSLWYQYIGTPSDRDDTWTCSPGDIHKDSDGFTNSDFFIDED